MACTLMCQVMNGYSEVMEFVFGPAGVGARSAVGMGSLPFSTSVEIEVIVEIQANETSPSPFSYKDLGVTPVLNAIGTLTSLGGSRLHTSVVQAMAAAATSFVDMNALFAAAGDEVARLCQAPPGGSQ